MTDDSTEDDALFLAEFTGAKPANPPQPEPENEPTQ